MRSFVATEIGELSVGLVANGTDEWLDRTVDVHVLFEAGRSAKLFATLIASMRRLSRAVQE